MTTDPKIIFSSQSLPHQTNRKNDLFFCVKLPAETANHLSLVKHGIVNFDLIERADGSWFLVPARTRTPAQACAPAPARPLDSQTQNID